MFIVFDLDGTLADCAHRLHHIRHPETLDGEYPPQDWTAFYEGVGADGPIGPILDLARTLVAADHRVEIWTGRSNECVAKTMEWLSRYGVNCFENRHHSPLVRLRMRVAGDRTADHRLKRQWIKSHGRPDLVFEDRASVVAMWRNEGIICAQVAPGDF